MSNKMTIDQAIRILDPTTSKAEVEKIRASIITDNDEDRYYATIAKVDEACVVACEVMRKWQRQENDRILTKENLQKWIEECKKLCGKPEEVIEAMRAYGDVYGNN